MCDIQSYPQEILPTDKHVYPLEMDNLLSELKEAYLLRRSTIEPEVMVFNGNSMLKEDALVNTSEVFNYSLNLSGGAFLEEHLPWKQLQEAQEEWSGGDVDLENYKGKVSKINPCYKIYFIASKLHNIPIPYVRHFDKKSDFDEHENRAALLANTAVETWAPEHKDIKLKGKITLLHDPIMLNYWHYVLDAFPADARKPLQKAKSAWQKGIKGAVLNILKNNFVLEAPANYVVPENMYLK